MDLNLTLLVDMRRTTASTTGATMPVNCARHRYRLVHASRDQGHLGMRSSGVWFNIMPRERMFVQMGPKEVSDSYKS